MQQNSNSTAASMVVKQFVEPEEFFSLVLSTRKLFRADQRAEGLRGLVDPERGTCYLVEEERLLATSRSSN